MHKPELPVDAANAEYVESLYADFLRNPTALAPEWRQYFQSNGENGNGSSVHAIGPSFEPRSIFHPVSNGTVLVQPPAKPDLQAGRLQERLDQLIRAYRVRGHLVAKVDPLGVRRPVPPELTPEYYGLIRADLDRPFSTTAFGGPSTQTLRSILERLQATYCRSIGAQFMHIDDLTVRDWLQGQMEETQNRIELSRDEQIRILTRLTDAIVFEQFVRKKYVGAKTYSLEGAESLIPLLHMAIEKAGKQGVREIVLAMAHRGRLNVLVNILGKSPLHVFQEFEDDGAELTHGRGDVKYHLGHSSDWITAEGQRIHLSLAFNPSHLEFVNPVAMGRLRAKQDRVGDVERKEGLVLMIHGDAAMPGEGIVQETFNISQLAGYTTGGALHIVLNNQIGFTTLPFEGRSSTYATDIAKMLQIPIFRVNGEDPEAVAQCVKLAMDFRAKFHRDVVIDMYCYRRLGHNESDEPTFTQPVMYREIETHESVRARYLDRLLKSNEITREEADRIADERRERLEEGQMLARQSKTTYRPEMLTGIWSGYQGGPEPADDEVNTGVPAAQLSNLLKKLTTIPDGFHLHRKLQRMVDDRRKMAQGELLLDWSAAEALAFATLTTEGKRIRFSGQDSIRGTFSHRHASFFDTETGEPYSPLQHLSPEQAPVEIINSPLSEGAVLGFEYGYSLDRPDGLVIWEAQFGDFANVAQVIIDQFIASAEDKWRRLSGLVLLLPHGFEGQGPEHSSARLERFLTLAAEDNMQIVYPTTPAQYFHLLRRQVLRRWRKPLVTMTPKSLLRHPKVVSTLDELQHGHFQRVIPDTVVDGSDRVNRVVLCSGKIYYELVDVREKLGRYDVAIVRLEQLYPFPEKELRVALDKYSPGTSVLWVQEEPENMGAWRYVRVLLGEKLFGKFPFDYVSRVASASPATGSHNAHKFEQEAVLAAAFEGL